MGPYHTTFIRSPNILERKKTKHYIHIPFLISWLLLNQVSQPLVYNEGEQLSWEQTISSSNRNNPYQCLNGFTHICDFKGSGTRSGHLNMCFDCSSICLDELVRTILRHTHSNYIIMHLFSRQQASYGLKRYYHFLVAEHCCKWKDVRVVYAVIVRHGAKGGKAGMDPNRSFLHPTG